MLAYHRNSSIQEAEINTDFLNDSLTYFLVKALELIWTPPVLDWQAPGIILSWLPHC